MPQWLVRLLRWIRGNPAKATILGALIALVAAGLITYNDIRNIENAARVSYDVPPQGTSGGTYAYRVIAPPSNNAKVEWVEIDNIVSTAPFNAMTTEPTWGTYVNRISKHVLGSGTGAPDVGVRFDVPTLDTSYTLVELRASIAYDYDILWTTFNLGFELEVKVPGPWNPATTAAQTVLPGGGWSIRRYLGLQRHGTQVRGREIIEI